MRTLTFCCLIVASFALQSRDSTAGPPVAGTLGKSRLRDVIDRHIAARFPKWKVKPAATCSDSEFLRRITLDLTGAIPTAAEVARFVADQTPKKREKLVDRLLKSDRFSKHMAVVFDVMLMERRADRYITNEEWRGYLERSFAKNKPYDTLVRELLGSDGTAPETRPAAKFYLDRAVQKDLLVRDIGRLFLGVDLQCAQCHDHPSIDDYLHEHYYGLSVFVAGSKIFRRKDRTMVLQETAMREVSFASVFTPEKTRTIGPKLLNAPVMKVPTFQKGEEYVTKLKGRSVRAVPKFSLRQLLAKTLPRAETKAFTRNTVNRLWALLMGRGIVHPLDMHHAGNPASHPKLLAALAEQFVASKFDVKFLLREIALSRTYQRSSRAPTGVDPDKIPPESFAVATMKGLSPEQLFESVVRATGSEKTLAKQIGIALKEDADAYKKLATDPKKLAQARASKRAERVKEFVALFGTPAGQPSGRFQASVTQALFLANSETIIQWIEPANGNLTEQLLKLKQPAAIAKQAYLTVLSRSPSKKEIERIQSHLSQSGIDRRTAVIEVVWSLLASAEFRLNH